MDSQLSKMISDFMKDSIQHESLDDEQSRQSDVVCESQVLNRGRIEKLHKMVPPCDDFRDSQDVIRPDDGFIEQQDVVLMGDDSTELHHTSSTEDLLINHDMRVDGITSKESLNNNSHTSKCDDLSAGSQEKHGGFIKHTENVNPSSGSMEESTPLASCGEISQKVVPPDGGYGWVVTMASFIVSFLIDGVSFSFGLFYLEFLDYYQGNKEQTAWAGSVLNGMYMITSPITGVLVTKYGCRKIAIIGSIVASCSLILSTFSPNIYVLIFTYGAMTGFGFGLLYLPAIVMVGFYFKKRRALATGIAVCGSGIGGFVFAPMCEKLIEIYGWKGANWIVGAICLNGVVCGALFRPLEMVNKEQTSGSASLLKQPTDCDVLLQADEDMPGSQTVLPSCEDDLITESSEMFETVLPHKNTLKRSSILELTHNNDGSSVSMINLSSHIVQTQDLKSPSRSYEGLGISKKLGYSESEQSTTTNSDSQQSSEFDDRTKEKNHHKSSMSDKQRLKCSQRLKNMCKSLVVSLKEMIDFGLLKNPTFCIYGLSCFLCMIGFFVPFVYLPDMGASYGLSPTQAAFLISIIGIANTVIRVVAGLVSDQPWADCLLINNCALVIGGIATVLCPFCVSYGLLGTYSAIFGSSIAVFVSLRSIIVVELLGIDKLTTSFGLMVLCQGLSSFIGAPIAGALYDATQSYNLSFYVAGVTIALAGIICFPLRRIALRRQNQV